MSATNPLLMPHISQGKSDKCANPPHTGDSNSCPYGDKAPVKPHISWGMKGGGGPGFTLTGVLRSLRGILAQVNLCDVIILNVKGKLINMT